MTTTIYVMYWDIKSTIKKKTGLETNVNQMFKKGTLKKEVFEDMVCIESEFKLKEEQYGVWKNPFAKIELEYKLTEMNQIKKDIEKITSFFGKNKCKFN